MSINLVMPSLGESVIEGTVTKWLVHEGETVAREQPVVSVATDKADSDVPAVQAGKIVKILAPEGATVKVGEPLCEIEPGAAALAPPPVPKAEPAPAKRKSETIPSAPAPSVPADNGSQRGSRTSPVVRKLALEQG